MSDQDPTSGPPEETLEERFEGDLVIPEVILHEDLLVPEGFAPPVQEMRRETARAWLAGTLVAVFLLTAGWVLAIAVFGNDAEWKNTKEALQILLPVESSLLGSAVVFYFTGNTGQR